MILRRELIGAFALAAVGLAAAELAAQPPPGGVARIGFLEAGTPGRFEAFRQGLNELGYQENRTIVIERRSAAGRIERMAELAADLVRLQPQVIVASSPSAALAAKRATATIPIVMTHTSDPIGLGLVESLARPGGNVTGLSSLATGLSAKRLELLAEIVPGLARTGIVWNPASQSAQLAYRELAAAAATLRLAIDSFEFGRPEDFDAAFNAASARTQGVVVLPDPISTRHAGAVIAAAERHRVPAVYFESLSAEAGGLASYGANIHDLHRRAATYVDKILKGAKPADLPIEQPTKFELVVNLKTAKALGIEISRSILLRADEVIE